MTPAGSFCNTSACNIQNLNAADNFELFQNFLCLCNISHARFQRTCASNQNFVIVLIYSFH